MKRNGYYIFPRNNRKHFKGVLLNWSSVEASVKMNSYSLLSAVDSFKTGLSAKLAHKKG